MAKVGIGLIGAGLMGLGVVKSVLERSERLEVRAVFDPDQRSVDRPLFSRDAAHELESGGRCDDRAVERHR